MLRFWVAVVVMVAAACAARGQFIGFDEGMGYDQWAMPATVEEVEALCIEAGADADVQAAAKSLVDGCEAIIQRDERRMQRAMERAWLTHKPEENAAVQEISVKETEKRTASHDEAAKTLMADLRAIMPKDSEAAWGAFERRRHRRLYLQQDWKTGVSVDLVAIARGEKIDSLPAVRGVLGPYEVALDAMLLARFPLVQAYEKRTEKAEPDQAAIEKAYNEVRDMDCAILHLQRENAQKLLAVVPEDKKGALRDRLLSARSPGVQTRTPLLERAEKLLKSGRLEEKKRRELQEGIKAFCEKSRALDEKNLTTTEDAECTRTYAQMNNPGEENGMRAWIADGRALQTELLAAVDKVATDDDLDAVSGP